MGGDKKEGVDADSAEFKQGVEAGLNSAEDTKNWKAGNELGRELKEEVETTSTVYECLNSKPATPLFMRNSLDGEQGTAQDEKDGTVE